MSLMIVQQVSSMTNSQDHINTKHIWYPAKITNLFPLVARKCIFINLTADVACRCLYHLPAYRCSMVGNARLLFRLFQQSLRLRRCRWSHGSQELRLTRAARLLQLLGRLVGQTATAKGRDTVITCDNWLVGALLTLGHDQRNTQLEKLFFHEEWDRNIQLHWVVSNSEVVSVVS